MRLLFITQVVDDQDPVLGFVCGWLRALAKHFSDITVICLREGKYDLPSHISVRSLGKERGVGRITYILNFYRYVWEERSRYDTVFVHMNQVHMLLGWPLWRMLNKRRVLWRNHPQGNVLTGLACRMADQVLYTSPQSYTAHYNNALRMPAGIDTHLFRREGEPYQPGRILALGRIAPVKHLEVLIDATEMLTFRDASMQVDIIGNPKPADTSYAASLKLLVSQKNMEKVITFSPAVTLDRTAALYNRAAVVVNTTPSGSMDKTILEAMACETLVLVSNHAFFGAIDARCMFKENNSEDLAAKLSVLLNLDERDRDAVGQQLRAYVVTHHGLDVLMQKLIPTLHG
jgi:glycosyltransferase involved in cell wall biosynthesis